MESHRPHDLAPPRPMTQAGAMQNCGGTNGDCEARYGLKCDPKGWLK
jgi:hypothetical protein